jgi:hypothetical protein
MNEYMNQSINSSNQCRVAVHRPNVSLSLSCVSLSVSVFVSLSLCVSIVMLVPRCVGGGGRPLVQPRLPTLLPAQRTTARHGSIHIHTQVTQHTETEGKKEGRAEG